MPLQIRDSFCFDDLLLIPKYSEISTRALVDTSVSFDIPNVGKFYFEHPIVPANMATITGFEMAQFQYNSGGLAILHRFQSLEDQLSQFQRLAIQSTRPVSRYVALSIGVSAEDASNLHKMYKAGVRIVCLDIAHADSKRAMEVCRAIKENYPDILLIAGNVATGDGAERLWRAGADIVKSNVGAGSICSTRIQTGNGVPQMTAISDANDVRSTLQKKLKRPLLIMSDGGAKQVGDIVKSLCFADMFMTGNMFAGTDETPGQVYPDGSGKCKSYVGSSTHKGSRIEGVAATVPVKGPAGAVLQQMIEGLQSGCSYQGVDKVKDLQLNPQFVKITNAGLVESNIHDVKVVK